MRPDDVDVGSDTYLNVPIAEFGEALLRGMGWSGRSVPTPISVSQIPLHFEN